MGADFGKSNCKTTLRICSWIHWVVILHAMQERDVLWLLCLQEPQLFLSLQRCSNTSVVGTAHSLKGRVSLQSVQIPSQTWWMQMPKGLSEQQTRPKQAQALGSISARFFSKDFEKFHSEDFTQRRRDDNKNKIFALEGAVFPPRKIGKFSSELWFA